LASAAAGVHAAAVHLESTGRAPLPARIRDGR